MFTLKYLLVSVPVILVTLAIHEYAHAKVADMLGDPTPRLSGRLTMNPVSHIDPIGFLMLFLFRFGWAKPVPIDPYNFRDSRAGAAYVGLAGPISNLFVAWLLSIVLKFLPYGMLEFAAVNLIAEILAYAMWINIALAVFNLIPVPPLDGSHILEALLPPEHAYKLREFGPAGFIFLIILIAFPPTQGLLYFIIESIFNFLL